jgi:hypothetical protein
MEVTNKPKVGMVHKIAITQAAKAAIGELKMFFALALTEILLSREAISAPSSLGEVA